MMTSILRLALGKGFLSFSHARAQAHSSSLARDDASLAPATQVVSEGERNPNKVGHVSIFESQYTLNRCQDKITICWGVERIFTQVECLKFTRSHFSVNAKKGCEKSSIAVQIDARI